MSLLLVKCALIKQTERERERERERRIERERGLEHSQLALDVINLDGKLVDLKEFNVSTIM